MKTAPTNTDGIIDSRDVIERIEELEAERDAHESDETACAWKKENPGEAAELATLEALRDDCGSSEFPHGLTLIADHYFEDYARELADDIGAVVKGAEWPNNCIDWERAACELQMDYCNVEFDGATYWFRA